MTPDEIVRQANEQGLQLVRFLYCDNGGVIRGKSTHVGQLTRRMSSGIGLVKGMQSFTSLDSLAPDASYGPVGEIRLVPDPATFTILPYAPRSGQMIANMVEHLLNSGLPYTSGPQWLAEHVLRDKWVLAVSGTHGKTTTSSMSSPRCCAEAGLTASASAASEEPKAMSESAACAC